MRKAFITALMLALTAIAAHAQGSSAEMADTLRNNVKIYVVVLVLATSFAGIIAFLVRLDRKMTKLEKNNS